MKIGNLVSADVCIFTAKSAFLEHAIDATDATDVTEMVSRMLARSPPSTHAGGQDDGSYTNSLKILGRHAREFNREYRAYTGEGNN